MYENDIESIKKAQAGDKFELEKLMHYKIKGIVFNKNENVQDRLNNVYSAMHGLNLSLIFLL